MKLPRVCEMALADLIRFGRLKQFGEVFAASQLHMPELSYEPRVIEALLNDNLAARDGAGVIPTVLGRKKQAEIMDERLGKTAA